MSDAAPARASGIDSETGEWTPAFPGQRRPFPKGHTYSMVSGANSERVIGPLAAQIMAEILADPQPPYLAHPILRGLLTEYARSRARERLLSHLIDRIGMPFGLDDDDDEDEPGVPLWRRREAARNAYSRAFTRTIALTSKLGMTPLAQVTAPPDALWRRAAAECSALEWPRPPIPPR